MEAAAEENRALPDGFPYTACYCEENVYRLCLALRERGLAAAGGDDLFVVFISNRSKSVPFWRQRSSARADGLAVWDYHVICVQSGGGGRDALVWDLDAAMPRPVALREYAREALLAGAELGAAHRRLFRVVAAPLYLRFFASDRRHMRDGEGRWLAPPPPSACIVAENGEAHNLHEYNMIMAAESAETRALERVEAEKLGVVLLQEQFLELFEALAVERDSFEAEEVEIHGDRQRSFHIRRVPQKEFA